MSKGGFGRGGFCPGFFLVQGGLCPRRGLSKVGYVLGGFVQGGLCPRGVLEMGFWKGGFGEIFLERWVLERGHMSCYRFHEEWSKFLLTLFS